MKHHILNIVFVSFLSFFASHAVGADWSAFSTIEKQVDGKTFKETVFLVNDSPKTVTLKFPNFEFPGHGDTPAESIGPLENIVLGPGDTVRFIHIIPADRKDGFATSIGIQDINDNIPITQHMVKESFGNK